MAGRVSSAALRRDLPLTRVAAHEGVNAAAVEDFGMPREPGLVVTVGGLVLVAAEKHREAGVHHVVLLQHLELAICRHEVFGEASVQAFLN